MRVLWHHRLPAQADTLLRADSGEIIAWCGTLHAFTPDLEPLWTVRPAEGALAVVYQPPFVWVAGPRWMQAFDLAGVQVHRFDIAIPEWAQVGGVVAVEDGFVLALEHTGSEITAPVLIRVDLPEST